MSRTPSPPPSSWPWRSSSCWGSSRLARVSAAGARGGSVPEGRDGTGGSVRQARGPGAAWHGMGRQHGAGQGNMGWDGQAVSGGMVGWGVALVLRYHVCSNQYPP